MLVYGDHKEVADPRERLAEVDAQLAALRAMPAGVDRHAKLVGALIEAGQLLQGVEDAGAPAEMLDQFVHGLAAAVVRSWDSRFHEIGELPSAPAMELPRFVELRLPEGFAFYGVYPEAYIESARRLCLSGSPRVIGIRSIGTSLGAVVAAALHAPPAVIVRPFGDPFARQVALPAELVDSTSHYVIVDEGPGLSGSSFGSVADWLEQRGVPPERIAFLPSHGGDVGPEASERHRQRWNNAQRIAAEFEPQFLVDRFGSLQEFSTGHPWERRKYLASRSAERVLLKFAGLGAIGERKIAMARALHAAGLIPEPLGLVHGFLVERWHADARPLAAGEKPIEEIGRYIGARAELFPAKDASGASIDQLLSMCRRNFSLAFGHDSLGALDGFDAARLSKRVVRARTDNKLDRAEWLRLPDGRLLKTDALDHHQAHDLIGCQDLAWDVAGAIVEFDLDDAEAMQLIRATGRRIDGELLAFYRLAYCAFRLGASHLACGSGSESARLYAVRVADLLHLHDRSATPRESLVG